MDDCQQAAPLSEDRPEHDGRVHDLSAVIPSVTTPEPSPTVSGTREAALLDALPSLGRTTTTTDPALSGSISLAGTFSSMGATGAAAPIGDELWEYASENDMYVEDVDDSAYVEQITETGAMAGSRLCGDAQEPLRRDLWANSAARSVRKHPARRNGSMSRRASMPAKLEQRAAAGRVSAKKAISRLTTRSIWTPTQRQAVFSRV